MRNRFYLTLLLIAGVVLLIYIALAAYREISPEWKGYQTDYRRMLLKKARSESEKVSARAYEIGVQQIYTGGLNRIDRCVSCHVGVENPSMADARQPFRIHSSDYLRNHPVEKFGCTVCHYGQGRATNKLEAHGLGHETYWDYPVIPLKYIQSSCALCHDIEMLKTKGGEKIARGEALFRERGCKGCHKLEGIGGVLGKPLDGVGSQPIAYFPMGLVQGERTVYSWMKEHFDDPRNIVQGSEMKSDFTDAEADLLTAYVLSIRSEEVQGKYRRAWRKGMGEKSSDGHMLYKMYCIACHTNGKDSINDEVFKRTIPAIMNPAFLMAADDVYLRKVLEEGRAGTQMTAWKAAAAGLTDGDISNLISYITKDRPKAKPEPFGFSKYKGNALRGEDLYKIRCISCHGDKGQGGVGLNLRNPVVQKNADTEFLAITIRDGRQGTHMAAFGSKGVGLSNPDIADIVTYVRTLRTKK